jgi:hypothetical protein
MSPKSERYGKSEIRWQPAKVGGWEGVVIRDSRRSEVLNHVEEAQLVAALRNEAGRLEPGYFGFEEAIARFRRFKPSGFDDGTGRDNERHYKEVASAALRAVATADQAIEADAGTARVIAESRIWTNMMAKFESARLKEVLLGSNGAAFVRGAAAFTAGDYDGGSDQMTRAINPHGRISWPLVTYLPFLWEPELQMFLKPTVTQDFSERVGLRFHHYYDPTPNAQTYRALLKLVEETHSAIAVLQPKDNIDIQSFIWVVGEYREEDLPA